MHYYASFITLLSLTFYHAQRRDHLICSVCVCVCVWMLLTWQKIMCMEIFNIYLIGITKSQLNMNEVHLNLRQKSFELLTWAHTYGCCSIFYEFFHIFIILEIPIWVKTSCYAKFYLWAFMWKRHFFIASTNFHCARREKRAANICQDIVWECVCVYVCRYVYE